MNRKQSPYLKSKDYSCHLQDTWIEKENQRKHEQNQWNSIWKVHPSLHSVMK